MGDFGDDFNSFGGQTIVPVVVGATDDWDALAVPSPVVVPTFASEFDEEFDAFKSHSNLQQMGTAHDEAEKKVSRQIFASYRSLLTHS